MKSAKPRAHFRVAQVAEALRKSAGIVTHAGAALGCTRQTVNNYIRRYPQLRAVQDEMIEATLDLCEAKVIQAIDAGDTGMIRFFLLTKGKHRGYTLRQEITGPGGKPIEMTDARDKLLTTLDEMGERLAAAGNGEFRSLPGGTNGAARTNGAGASTEEVIE